MTLPCLLIAPQKDLQAFIKLGRAKAFGWPTVDMCMWVWLYKLCTCVCVCLRRGPQWLPEVAFHSLLFHYSYKATAWLRSAALQKRIFPSNFLSFSHTPSSFSSLSSMVVVGIRPFKLYFSPTIRFPHIGPSSTSKCFELFCWQKDKQKAGCHWTSLVEVTGKNMVFLTLKALTDEMKVWIDKLGKKILNHRMRKNVGLLRV